MDICGIFQVVAVCQCLESFSLLTCHTMVDKNFLDRLLDTNEDGIGGSCHWRCRQSLRKLKLRIKIHDVKSSELKSDKALLEKMSDTVSMMGGYQPRYRNPRKNAYGANMNATKVWKTLELVQRLENLETIVLDDVVFTSTPSKE
ncbi:hypothetical protein BG015_009561 [Linnemannia schmuckeri]|uniref:Uncharacterized protein n=1 Tax=Linnemannia schmuckeri TaxID=64567 RepID=A0A9P5RYV7_9FUNG|nr:hypothetical protein BG015_009561 [Linnemannia schmuckeri]